MLQLSIEYFINGFSIVHEVVQSKFIEFIQKISSKTQHIHWDISQLCPYTLMGYLSY